MNMNLLIKLLGRLGTYLRFTGGSLSEDETRKSLKRQGNDDVLVDELIDKWKGDIVNDEITED